MFDLDVPDGTERLLVALHGYGDEPDALAACAREAGAFASWTVRAPRGPARTPGGPAWFASQPGDDGPELVDVLDALDESIEAACRRAGTQHVALLGWSQGAATALALALRSSPGASSRVRPPDLLIGLAPWLPNEPGLELAFEPAAAKGTTVVLVHGDADEVVPVAQGRSAARVLDRAGIDVTFVERDAGHVLAPLLDAAHRCLVARG